MNGTVELPIGPEQVALRQLVRLGGAAHRAMADQLHPQHVQRATQQHHRCGNHAVCQCTLCRRPRTGRLRKGHAEWNGPNGNTGTFFGTDNYLTTADPQCADTAVSPHRLLILCTLNALAVRVPAGAPRSFALPEQSRTCGVCPCESLPGQIGTLGNRTHGLLGTVLS